MRKQDYNLNYYSERTTKAEEEAQTITPKTSKKQKCLIFTALAVALIIITAAILLYIFVFSSKSKSFDAEIYCVYDIKDASKEISILGKKKKKLSSLDIYINNKKIDKSKKYKFAEKGENLVKFKFHEDLNMDYMYQDIPELKSVYMNTTKKGKITSMKSTFENCINIKSLIIDGFNTKKIESMNRLFYGTNISISDI